MMARRPVPKNGFTLIEMMVAMSILVILTGSLYTCFISVVDSAEIARSSIEGLRVQEFLREHFNNNLSAVHASPVGEYALIGEDESGAYGPADTLSFTTTLPTSGALSLPGIVKTVEYKIDEPSFEDEGGFKTFTIDAPAEDEEMESVMMFITERPLVLGEDGEGGDLFVDDEAGLWQREVGGRLEFGRGGDVAVGDSGRGKSGEVGSPTSSRLFRWGRDGRRSRLHPDCGAADGGGGGNPGLLRSQSCA